MHKKITKFEILELIIGIFSWDVLIEIQASQTFSWWSITQGVYDCEVTPSQSPDLNEIDVPQALDWRGVKKSGIWRWFEIDW